MISISPIKSVCIVFKPKSSKLYCPNVKLDCHTTRFVCCYARMYPGNSARLNKTKI